MNHLNTKTVERLFHAILNLENIDECRNFFEDICTVKEIRDIAQRLEVAELLDIGTSYQEIYEKTNVSTATISRVSKCLNYGNGGYKSAIEKLGKMEK